MGLGCWYARSTGGWWNGSWKDFHLSCSGNALQIGDLESCNGVATVHFMGEYPWTVGDFGIQWLTWHCRWRTGVESAPELELCIPPPVGDPENTTSWAYSTYICPSTSLGGNNAGRVGEFQYCHRRDDTWNRFHTRQLVGHRTWESHLLGFQYHYWRAGNPMQYPPFVVWYLNIQRETIKQWPVLTLFLEFWDVWWISSIQDEK